MAGGLSFFSSWREGFSEQGGKSISYSLLCTCTLKQYDNEANFIIDTNAIEFTNQALHCLEYLVSPFLGDRMS